MRKCLFALVSLVILASCTKPADMPQPAKNTARTLSQNPSDPPTPPSPPPHHDTVITEPAPAHHDTPAGALPSDVQ